MFFDPAWVEQRKYSIERILGWTRRLDRISRAGAM